MAKQSLAEATKKANIQANLNLIDEFGSSKDNFEQESELSVIESVLGDFIKRVKTNIQKEDMIVTGAIDDIFLSNDEEGVKVFAPKHLKYQDKGVNGSKMKLYETPFEYKTKKPPIEPFKEWVKRRGIGGEDEERVAYAIREKVFQEGIEPKNVYTKEIPQLVQELASHIAGFNANQVVSLLKES